MKSVFRATTPDDEARLAEFLCAAFSVPPNSPFVDSALMHWKYWRPREDYDGPRSYVLERDGRIVAHSGVWPMPFRTAEGGACGMHMMDWASHPGAPGSGLALVQRFTRMFDFLISIGGTAMTRKTLAAFGCQTVAEAWVAARPLKPLQQALSHQHVNWKLPARLLRNAWWSQSPAAERLQGWSLKPIDAGHSDAGPLEGATSADSRRGGEFFRYLNACPVAQFRFFHLFDGDRCQGRLALSIVQKQARVAGIWLNAPNPQAFDAAYVLAQDQARQIASVCEIAVRGATPESRAAVIRSGFRIVDAMPVFLFRRQEAFPPVPFQYQIADNDAVFLSSGSPEFFT